MPSLVMRGAARVAICRSSIEAHGVFPEATTEDRLEIALARSPPV